MDSISPLIINLIVYEKGLHDLFFVFVFVYLALWYFYSIMFTIYSYLELGRKCRAFSFRPLGLHINIAS